MREPPGTHAQKSVDTWHSVKCDSGPSRSPFSSGVRVWRGTQPGRLVNSLASRRQARRGFANGRCAMPKSPRNQTASRDFPLDDVFDNVKDRLRLLLCLLCVTLLVKFAGRQVFTAVKGELAVTAKVTRYLGKLGHMLSH